MESEEKITISVKMNRRWVPYFWSMLKRMEYLGVIGSSRTLSFYSDGDGDFRPKFETESKIDLVEPINDLYDAG